jgi:hypothetical protein
MVRLMLCRFIRISTQVSEFVVVRDTLCLKIVAVWWLGAYWNPTSADNITYHMVQLESQISNGFSSQTLYYAMKNVR